MIIQLTDVHSCQSHGCRVIETKVLRPPAHTCVCGQPTGSRFTVPGNVLICATPAYVCVCAGKSQMPTEPLKQNFLTCRTHSCALATAHQHKTQSSHFNFSDSFWPLGQGVLTFYNTHMCVCTDGPSCSHSFCPKKHKPYPACTKEYMII